MYHIEERVGIANELLIKASRLFVVYVNSSF